jgi:molybdenum cofactor cytidylyltransferase
VKLAGLILSAGESRRMGSPKALLSYEGETFLDTLISRFADHFAPVIVVLGAQAETIRSGIRLGANVRFVVNPDPSRGQLSSLQCGLHAVPGDTEAVMVTLVDHPAVTPATIAALSAGEAPLLRVPRYHGRRGHPIVIGRALIPEFLALPPTASAKDVVRRQEAQILDVDDPGILADIDDPAAYLALTGARP